MNKIVKRVMNMFVAGAMALSLLAPVTEVSAATKNKVVEIPVNFTNTLCAGCIPKGKVNML